MREAASSTLLGINIRSSDYTKSNMAELSTFGSLFFWLSFDHACCDCARRKHSGALHFWLLFAAACCHSSGFGAIPFTSWRPQSHNMYLYVPDVYAHSSGHLALGDNGPCRLLRFLGDPACRVASLGQSGAAQEAHEGPRDISWK